MTVRNVVIDSALGYVKRYGCSDFTSTLGAGESQLAVSDFALLAGGANPNHVKVTAGALANMTQAEIDAVDASLAAARTAKLQAELKTKVLTSLLADIPYSVAISGLTLTTNITDLITDDLTTVTADPADTKYVKLCYVYNSASDSFSLQAFERTTGLYADLAADEHEVSQLGEWTVVANGTVLVEVS